jgi:hypothetical protein
MKNISVKDGGHIFIMPLLDKLRFKNSPTERPQTGFWNDPRKTLTLIERPWF